MSSWIFQYSFSWTQNGLYFIRHILLYFNKPYMNHFTHLIFDCPSWLHKGKLLQNSEWDTYMGIKKLQRELSLFGHYSLDDLFSWQAGEKSTASVNWLHEPQPWMVEVERYPFLILSSSALPLKLLFPLLLFLHFHFLNTSILCFIFVIL